MTDYSKTDGEMLPEAEEFSSRLNAFFDGAPLPPAEIADLNAGASDEQIEQRRLRELNELEAAFTALENGEAIPAIRVGFYMSCPDEELPEKIYDEPEFVSRYEKLFLRVRELKARLECANPDEAPQIEADLIVANAAWDIEKARMLDSRGIKQHLIDRWRATEGRDKYNASRRKKRDKPNADLSVMSEDERVAHRKAIKADSAYRKRKEKAGWFSQEIKDGLLARQTKRQEKTTSKST